MFPNRRLQNTWSGIRKPPSQTWRTFLSNHASQLVSVDFFTVPTISFHILYVFIVLAHNRRHILHFNVTAHPTAEWTAQQIVEAFPFDSAPRYLLRDNDQIYGCEFRRQLEVMGIREVRTSFRSPWQNAFVERVIGSIRRECLDHVIVLNEESLRRVLRSYIGYYHASRLHLSLEKDSPTPRDSPIRWKHRRDSSSRRIAPSVRTSSGLKFSDQRQSRFPLCRWALHRRAFKTSRPATDAETPRRYNPKITNRNVHFAQHRLDPSIFRPDEVFGRDNPSMPSKLRATRHARG